ncbi:MAG TPA: holo-ACP synthase [Polyangiaceae bacterium]|jgi:holo-[acyl-carrier protein] synthase
MIVGMGIDVCSIDRMRKALERHGDRFFHRICSEQERADFAQLADRAQMLAGRFAAKEAFAKALDGAPGVGWHEVVIRRGPTGRPQMTLVGLARTVALDAGALRWHLSITHDAGIAAAVVILES